MYKNRVVERIIKLMMLVGLVAGLTGLAEASTGSIIDTFADESLIASRTHLDVISGKVYLDAVSTKYETNASATNKYEALYSTHWGAQTFTTTATDHKINSVKLQLRREGTSTAYTLYAYIYATSGGSPVGPALSSGSYLRGSIPLFVTSITIPMSELVISPGTVYTIVLSCPSATSLSNVQWYGYETSSYPGGAWFSSANSGGSWTLNSARDHTFEVWGDAYYSSGNFVSANLLDDLDVSSIDSFDYKVSSLPDGSSLQVQFSPDNVNWYNSSGVLNGWESLSAGENTISLSSLGWSGEIFYYKTQFLSSSAVATAILDEIKLNYSEGVPEPASLLFLGIGIVGLEVKRQLTRKRKIKTI